jgi:hypothetical protein
MPCPNQNPPMHLLGRKEVFTAHEHLLCTVLKKENAKRNARHDCNALGVGHIIAPHLCSRRNKAEGPGHV